MSTQLVKELRERTGAGILDCKKALEASNNNIEKAIVWLQEKGAANAAKKAGAIAAEGIVKTSSNKTHVIIFELNSQTDFVASNKKFEQLANKISDTLLINDFNTIKEALNIEIDGIKINELILQVTTTIGEKIELRRAERIAKKENVIGCYTHVNNKVAALVVAEGGTEEILKNVSMHVASMNPQFLDESSVPSKKIKVIKEKIKDHPMLKEKPENIKDQISKGMLRKKLAELTLVDQEFVMEKISVAKYLEQNKAKVIKMVRYEVGEGIEKQESNFAKEVAEQMKK